MYDAWPFFPQISCTDMYGIRSRNRLYRDIIIIMGKLLCILSVEMDNFDENTTLNTSFSPALGIRVLVDAREKLHIPWGNPSNQQHGDTMMAFDTRSAMAHGHGMVEHKVFQHYLPSIRALWADEGIQNAYDRRREFQLVSKMS